ncbi:MAG: acetolactate synthase small subunit [Acidimicrobiia bacterium]|jgi:acetolactate synthase-1/3 small subunit
MNHVISVLVENKPGVLARVASMFARRGFNIHSLAVSPTTDPLFSRITMVIDGPDMEQIIKQLYKLVHTVKVTEMVPGEMVQREVMLLRVNADRTQRGEVLDAAGIFEAKTVDVGAASITFEVSGDPDRLADFLELMKPYGIVDLAKSGRIALGRDAKSKNGAKTALRSA